jgi:hypothetical protein
MADELPANLRRVGSNRRDPLPAPVAIHLTLHAKSRFVLGKQTGKHWELNFTNVKVPPLRRNSAWASTGSGG